MATSRAHTSAEESRAERDLLGTYLEEISRTPLLDADGEVELAQRIEAGLGAERRLNEESGLDAGERSELLATAELGQRAREAFIRANLRLVVSVARRYPGDSMSLLDRIQEGNLGLLRAVERFDYRRGFKFSTYATWWIRQAIGRGLANTSRTVRLPQAVHDEVSRLRRARRELSLELGADPAPEQLAQALDLPVERIAALDRWSLTPASLDSLVGDDEETALGDLLPAEEGAGSPERSALAHEGRERLHQLVERLTPRAAQIVRARYGLDDGRERTRAEVAAEVGLSRERVRRIEADALHKLRRLAQEEQMSADLADLAA